MLIFFVIKKFFRRTNIYEHYSIYLQPFSLIDLENIGISHIHSTEITDFLESPPNIWFLQRTFS